MKSVLKKIENKIRITDIYFIGMLFFIIVSAYNCIRTNGIALYDMLVPNYQNHYWDLFTSIFYNFSGEPYESGVVYPPGANIICFCLSKFFPDELYFGGTNAMRDSQVGMVVMLWFILLTTIVLFVIVFRDYQGRSQDKFIFIITIIFSAPYIREITKMNIITISIIFVYIFLLYKDDERPIFRWLAIGSLAVAVAIKIYPVFFGIYLLKDKKWKTAIQCIIAGILIFFVPFCLFGGVDSIFLMIKNIFNTTSIFNQSGLGFKIDITNTINIIGELVGYNGNIRLIGTVFNYSFLLLGLVTFLGHTEKWKSIAILSLLTLSYPTFSNSYAILIMIPALIAFLNSKPEINILNLIYVILFVLLFAPMCFGGQDIFPGLSGVTRVNLFTFVESISIIVMELLLIAEGGKNLINQVRRKKSSGDMSREK